VSKKFELKNETEPLVLVLYRAELDKIALWSNGHFMQPPYWKIGGGPWQFSEVLNMYFWCLQSVLNAGYEVIGEF